MDEHLGSSKLLKPAKLLRCLVFSGQTLYVLPMPTFCNWVHCSSGSQSGTIFLSTVSNMVCFINYGDLGNGFLHQHWLRPNNNEVLSYLKSVSTRGVYKSR